MDFKEFMRVLEKPYWCAGSPLEWHVDGAGFAHYAMDGRVGMFNLCWFVFQRQTPPKLRETYANAKERFKWVIALGDRTMIDGKSLTHHAAMLPYESFRCVVYRHISKSFTRPVDFPGSVPWKTLYDLSTAKGKL